MQRQERSERLQTYDPQEGKDHCGSDTGKEALVSSMTAEGLRVELEPLEFLVIEELERDVVEGPGHTGSGAVVQVIARKAQ